MIAQSYKAAAAANAHDPLSRRIGNLKRQRAKLEEEVSQLRAAVGIWQAVCERTKAVAKAVTVSTDRIQ